MPERPEDVSESLDRLKEIADEKDVEVDSSFVVGIKSYLQMERVRDLSKV